MIVNIGASRARNLVAVLRPHAADENEEAPDRFYRYAVRILSVLFLASANGIILYFIVSNDMLKQGRLRNSPSSRAPLKVGVTRVTATSGQVYELPPSSSSSPSPLDKLREQTIAPQVELSTELSRGRYMYDKRHVTSSTQPAVANRFTKRTGQSRNRHLVRHKHRTSS